MSAFRSRSEQASGAGQGPAWGQKRQNDDLLPPAPVARQGRILPSLRPGNVVDVEFEIVAADARRAVYPVFNDNQKDRPTRHAAVLQPVPIRRSGSDLVEALMPVERFLRRISSRSFAAAVVVVCGFVFLAALGWTGTSPEVSAQPALSLSPVTTALGDANGMKIMSVYGAVENRSGVSAAVPTVLIDVIDNGRLKSTIRVASPEPVLAPGKNWPFTVRLPHAGGKMPDVTVSFSRPDASTD